MRTLCVIGEESRAVLAALAERVADAGRVATLDCVASDELAEQPDGVDTAVSVAGDGTWRARGDDRSPIELLDSLAPHTDYALVAGLAHHRLPTLVVGDPSEAVAAAVGVDDPEAVNVVAVAETAETVDLDGLADRIDTFEPHVTLETLIQAVKAGPGAERSGAIATFTGRVRSKDSDEDARTERLSFETYADVAAERMDAIREALAAREGVFDVRMHHRVGTMLAGEDIVFVVVLAGHREAAFRTVEDGINRLKDEVPIFKKETTETESFWLHEKA